MMNWQLRSRSAFWKLRLWFQYRRICLNVLLIIFMLCNCCFTHCIINFSVVKVLTIIEQNRKYILYLSSSFHQELPHQNERKRKIKKAKFLLHNEMWLMMHANQFSKFTNIQDLKFLKNKCIHPLDMRTREIWRYPSNLSLFFSMLFFDYQFLHLGNEFLKQKVHKVTIVSLATVNWKLLFSISYLFLIEFHNIFSFSPTFKHFHSNLRTTGISWKIHRPFYLLNT